MIWSQDTYQHAWNYACKVHIGQTVPGTDLPYANHIANVAMEVMTAMALTPADNPDLAIQAALLHDTIEDASITHAEIEARFGKAVADGVAALSKNASLPTKREQMQDSLARILQQPREIGMVKMADRITNLQPPPGHWSRDKITAYREEAIEIHHALSGCHPVLAKRLWEKIEKYRQYL